MKLRRHLFLLLMLLLVGGLLLVPSVHWPVYGWLRGEAFYQGMPTSYWGTQIRLCFALEHDTLQEALALVGLRASNQYDDALLERDLEAVPVLVELLQDRHPKVRLLAAILLYDVAPTNHAPIPVLVDLLRERDEGVRSDAIFMLGQFGPAARNAIPRLCGALNDDGFSLHTQVLVEALERIDPEAAAKAGIE